MTKSKVMAHIQKQAEDQMTSTESLAQAIARILRENPELYTQYMDAAPDEEATPPEEDMTAADEMFQKQADMIRKAHPDQNQAAAMDEFLRSPEGAQFYEKYMDARNSK